MLVGDFTGYDFLLTKLNPAGGDHYGASEARFLRKPRKHLITKRGWR